MRIVNKLPVAILTTIITSQPFEICSVRQAAEDIGLQCEYVYALIRKDSLDVTYPFPHGGHKSSGQQFVVKNDKYFSFRSRWKDIHDKDPDWNKKGKNK